PGHCAGPFLCAACANFVTDAHDSVSSEGKSSVRNIKFIAFLATAAMPITAAHADEGMWTFDAFPTARMQAAYGWAPDQAWLDKARSAAVRLTGGCSASFVSADGLILTNHH